MMGLRNQMEQEEKQKKLDELESQFYEELKKGVTSHVNTNPNVRYEKIFNINQELM